MVLCANQLEGGQGGMVPLATVVRFALQSALSPGWTARPENLKRPRQALRNTLWVDVLQNAGSRRAKTRAFAAQTNLAIVSSAGWSGTDGTEARAFSAEANCTRVFSVRRHGTDFDMRLLLILHHRLHEFLAAPPSALTRGNTSLVWRDLPNLVGVVIREQGPISCTRNPHPEVRDRCLLP
jgi:hypothetical protein